MKILLAEDDPLIGAGMESGLRMAGFSVDWAQDGVAADTALATGHYAILLLDLGLPRQDGLTLLKRLRQRGNLLPVLIATARDAVADRIEGLNQGADDYLIKPFDLEELIARVHALLRRHRGRGRPEMQVGGLVLNPLTHQLHLDGQPIVLSQKEFSLLELLMETPGAVHSRQALEERLYGWQEEVLSNAVEVHLHKLRKKLGMAWIRNIRGVGYCLVDPSLKSAPDA